MAIDGHARVKRWVRNLDSHPEAGFWLPTSTGKFYPDFVCELVDGRLAVVEFKGDHIRTLAKEIEKGQVGAVWAERSAGAAVFAMVFFEDGGGPWLSSWIGRCFEDGQIGPLKLNVDSAECLFTACLWLIVSPESG